MKNSHFISDLDIRKVGAYKWKVLKDLVYYSVLLGGIVILPAGSIIDFASTPRWLWWLVPKSGQYDFGTALHDGAYQNILVNEDWQRINVVKHLADLLMDEANKAVGVDEKTRLILLKGVQWFGYGHQGLGSS